MYMTITTVADFRKNLKEALDTASSGKTVSFYRGKERFLLVSETAVQEAKSTKTKQFAQEYDTTPIEGYSSRDDAYTREVNKMTKAVATAKDEEVLTLGGIEAACCKGARPCRHWVWDSSTGEGYKNSLSGRTRSADE